MSVNLLPWRDDLKNKKVRLFYWQVVIVFFVSVVLCAIFYMKESKELMSLKQEVNDLRIKTLIENPRTDEFQALVSSKNGIKNIDFLGEKIKENMSLLDILFFIGQEMPDALYLIKFEKKENVVRFYGRAISQLDVVYFAKIAENKFPHKKILIDEINRVDGKDYKIDFVLSLLS